MSPSAFTRSTLILTAAPSQVLHIFSRFSHGSVTCAIPVLILHTVSCVNVFYTITIHGSLLIVLQI